MVAVYQKNESILYIDQPAADTNVTMEIPLPDLLPTQAIKVTHISTNIYSDVVATWAAAACSIYLEVGDGTRRIMEMAFSNNGGTGYVDCVKVWDDVDGFFTAQKALSVTMLSSNTGAVNVAEVSVFFDVVTVTETNKNQLLLGKPAVLINF